MRLNVSANRCEAGPKPASRFFLRVNAALPFRKMNTQYFEAATIRRQARAGARQFILRHGIPPHTKRPRYNYITLTTPTKNRYLLLSSSFFFSSSISGLSAESSSGIMSSATALD